MAKKQLKKADVQPTSILSSKQQQKLVQCEKMLSNHSESFSHAGQALKVINDENLYLTFGTFDDYCLQKWGMSKTHAYRLMKAYEVMEELRKEFSPSGKIPLPVNESQVRPLTPFKLNQVVSKWEQVVKQADGKPITAEHVEAVVSKTSASKKASNKTKNNGALASFTVKELTDMSNWLAQAKAELDDSESEVVELLVRIETILGKYLK